MGERNRQKESCQRAQTTHRVATDLGRSAIRNAQIAAHVLGVSAAFTVKAVVGLGRSTVRGMSSVMKRDDEDDKEGTEDDAGALQDQIDLLTQRLAKVKDADDSMILSLLVQTVKTRCKTILQRHRRCVTRITHHDKSKTHLKVGW